jgi:RNA polymerase sigma factor (sigma-70 family)
MAVADRIRMTPRKVVLMSSTGSVTHWIEQLKAGDPDAAEPLWERYRRQLLRLARRTLDGSPRRAADEEDVALSAFFSFCRVAARGQFQELLDRDDLEQLLVVLTTRKALHQLRAERARKRRGMARGPGPLLGQEAAEEWVEQLLGREPTPEFLVQAAEEYQRLLDSLGDPELRSIALWRVEGYTTEEIAARLNRAPRTVERRLRLIRMKWEKEMEP